MMSSLVWGGLRYTYMLVVVGVMAVILWYRLHKTRRAIALLAGKWSSVLIHNFSLARATGKMGLSVVGLLFLVIALLRPQGKMHEDKIAQQGRDVYFALDISRSMLAADGIPDRLTWAKEKIKQTISRLTCERVGLILFSGSACIQCPLTSDIAAFLLFLNQVDVETISSGTTALDQALIKALDAFESMPPKKNKLLVVFTDGEDFSTSLEAVKQRAHEQGLYIFALGVGSLEGAPIPLVDHFGNSAGYLRDGFRNGEGAVVISQLNEKSLRSLVHDVGGEYIRVTSDDRDIRTLVKKVQSFEKESLGDGVIKRCDEKYPYCVAISFICFVIEWLL